MLVLLQDQVIQLDFLIESILYVFSGKTIAFALPILERLLYKPHQTAPCTRVLVLAPTRELCVQIHQVFRQLTQFAHNITACLSTGKILMINIFCF